MKLHEALNLYGLHKNPEELAGHDKIEQSPFKMGKWAWFTVGDPGIFTSAGNSSLDLVKKEAGPIEVNAIVPFELQEFNNQMNWIDSRNYDEDEDEDGAYDEYRAVRKQFIAAASSFRPNTIMTFELDFEDGILVCEQDPYSTATIFDRDNDGEDDDSDEDDDWDD